MYPILLKVNDANTRPYPGTPIICFRVHNEEASAASISVDTEGIAVDFPHSDQSPTEHVTGVRIGHSIVSCEHGIFVQGDIVYVTDNGQETANKIVSVSNNMITLETDVNSAEVLLSLEPQQNVPPGYGIFFLGMVSDIPVEQHLIDQNILCFPSVLEGRVNVIMSSDDAMAFSIGDRVHISVIEDSISYSKTRGTQIGIVLETPENNTVSVCITRSLIQLGL